MINTGRRIGVALSAGSIEGRGRTATPRRIPERNAAFSHLSIGDLRAYRQALAEEENRVSYWRRIIQARLDVVRAGEAGTVRVDNLRNVLAEARHNSGRQVLITVVPLEDIPPLPDLAKLWEREPRPGHPAHNEALARDLAGAEIQLSAYRAALHRRITGATAELIARYREDPSLCLLALPANPHEAEQRRALAARR
jgi:RsiG-like